LVPTETHQVFQTEDDETDIPEEMEGILDDLFQAIQDKVLGAGCHYLKPARSERSLGYHCSLGSSQRHWQDC
jgi:hypothetical protein